MMASSRRGLVAPQNTFIDAIGRKAASQGCSFLLANARIVEFPIVHSSASFCAMSGFNASELLQRSSTCSFMHGELTNHSTVTRLQEALQKQVEDQMEILLYKKNKTPLWLLVHVAPIKCNKDAIMLILLLFKDITLLKQPIPEQNGKGSGLGKFAWLARTVARNRQAMLPGNTANPAAAAAAAPGSDIVSSSSPPRDTTQDEVSPNSSMSFVPSEALPYYRQEAPKTPQHIILHYSVFKAKWNWLILLLTFYTAVMVPYNVAFHSKTLDSPAILIVDGVVDVVFFVDILINFHTTFVSPAGEVISDPRVIRLNYLKTWFVIDLLSCLPYDLVNAFHRPNQQSISTQFSALKVVRLLRLARVARKLDLYIEYGAAVLALLLIMFVLIAHWFACIWFTIGDFEAHSGVFYGWLQTLGRDIGDHYVMRNSSGEIVWDGGPSDKMAYVTALYFTLSCMTSVGFGNVSAFTQSEKIFSVFMMILGSLLYATIFGNVTTIFQQMYSTTGRYHEMLKSIKEFMKLHQVPVSLSERVMDYVISNWAATKGIDPDKVMSHCPKDMKADLCIHLNRTVFSENPAFRLASNGCLRALAVHFNRIHCAPGDMVFHQGESLDLLCFIVIGSLEVVQDDEVVAILSKGDVFGDKFSKDTTVCQSTANVRALTYCDLHVIKRDNLLQVLHLYNSFANSFSRNLTLTYNLRQRMVFRKLVDVQREKELAERRKDDPPLDVSADLAVRKLLSRMRRTSENHRTLSSSSQAELDDCATSDKVTGNSISSAHASKPSAKLQFAKLLRGTVASSAAATTLTSASTSSTPPKSNASALDTSTSAQPPAHTAIKTGPTSPRGITGQSTNDCQTFLADHLPGPAGIVEGMKVEIRREMQQLNKRIDQIDKHLSAILLLLTGETVTQRHGWHDNGTSSASDANKIPRSSQSPSFMDTITEQDEEMSSLGCPEDHDGKESKTTESGHRQRQQIKNGSPTEQKTQPPSNDIRHSIIKEDLDIL